MAERNVVIAVGGTGNKIMEAMVYGAAAGVFYTRENNKEVPIRSIDMLSVDVDALCGNTTRAMHVCEAYNKVYDCLKHYNHKGFSSHINLMQMDFSMGSREKSVSGQVINNRSDRPLADALFNEKESQLEYAEGFRGHPDLGVMFFSEVVSNIKLNMMNKRQNQANQNSLTKLMGQMRQTLQSGYVNVILVGSIFGGTGASGIPILSRFLRDNLESPRLRIAAVLMLPYYNVPPKNSGDILDLEIVIDSSEFMDKAKTALGYYGSQRMLRMRTDDDGVYDTLYMMGLPTEAFITMRRYATGTGDQENDSHLMEWLAVRAAAHFFRFGTSSIPSVCAQQGKCYAYQMQSGSFSWHSFDLEESRYRQSYGGMVKAGVVYLAECYPYIRSVIEDPARCNRNEVNYYASHFLHSSKLSPSARTVLVGQLDAIADLFRFMLYWMIQVLRSLPPSMRVLLENESAPLKARNTYVEKYLPIAAALRIQKQGGKSDKTVTQKAFYAAQREKNKDMSSLPPVQQYRELERVRRAEAASHKAALERLQEARDALDALKNVPVTPEMKSRADELEHQIVLYQSAERLAGFRLDVIQDDQSILLSHFDGRSVQQESEGEDDYVIPDNDLMDAELMRRLGSLLGRLTRSDTDNDSNGCAPDIQYLLSNINGFIRQDMRDRVNITSIYEELGRGSTRRKKVKRSKDDGEQSQEVEGLMPETEQAQRESSLLDSENVPRSAAVFLVCLMNAVTKEATGE